MRPAIIAAALALITVLATAPSEKANAQAIFITCYGQTFSVGHSPDYDDFFWKGVSTCDLPIHQVGVLTGFFIYNWDSGLWEFQQVVGGAVDVRFAAANGFKTVPPYLGINCAVAMSYHWAMSDIFDDAVTVSPAQCY